MALAVAATAGPASAAPPGWAETAARIAAPWPALQSSSGHFADYVTSRARSSQRDDYGDAMLGYALLQRAAATGDTGMRDAGLRAIGHALRSRGHVAVAPFRFMALASAYNLARTSFASAPLFASLRSRWQHVLRGVKILRVGRAAVTNKSLVEAVEILELARSGLRSSTHGAVLNNRRHATALVKRLLAHDLPRAARGSQRSAGSAGRTALIGDFSGLPLPYHALATGFLARAIALLGPSAPAASRRLLGEAANASWALAAPDGDVGYIGRSQEQSWTLALTAFGAETAARQPGAAARAARYRGLSERTVARLGDDYRVGTQGLFVTPALDSNLSAGIRGLDPYVAAASYNGLTLVALDWAIDAAGAGTAPGPLAADSDGTFVLGRGARTFAAVRRGNVWFAVKQAKSDPSDLRYDFGLVALKVRDAQGAWHSMPLRPRVDGARQTAGPLLRGSGLPAGTRLSASAAGTVTVSGGYRTRAGRWLRRGVRFRYSPTACGVELRAPTRKGDSYDYSAFFTSAPHASGGALDAGGQTLSFSPSASSRSRGGFASGSDAPLTRTTLHFANPGAAGLRVTDCVG